MSRPRLLAWSVILVALVTGGLLLAFKGTAPANDDPTADLPAGVESATVAELVAGLPSGDQSPAVIVYSRGGEPLTAADRAAVSDDADAFADVALGGRVVPPVFSKGKDAAFVVVPLASEGGDAEGITQAVDDLRATVADGLPDGLTGQVTGAAGFQADLGAVFDGADVNLLLSTVIVVAVLLLITYRSPVLWIVPLAVIGFADQVAASLFTVLTRVTGLDIADGATTGIASVLVFGAGTNYALLIVARYREELRRTEDRFAAMASAWRSAGPAILASASTVVLSLLTLLAAVLPFNRNVGIAGAIGIAVALAFALVVLPAALVLCGRWLFWPFIPRVGSEDPARSGFWAKTAGRVAARPAAFLAAGAAVLVALSVGLTTLSFGLQQTDQFRQATESVDGQKTLARYFEAGASQPLTVTTTVADQQRVAEVAKSTPGVSSAMPAEAAGKASSDVATVSVVLEAEPGSADSDAAIDALRGDLDAVSTDALVGGQVAEDLDTKDAAARDVRVVVPLVLLVVALVLGLLLRSVVASALLILTVIASFFAALGASSWAFTHLLGYEALDYTVPLLAFLFLVALGVDYNIFLTARAREEAARLGTREGMVVSLAVTGGVITSAGILLAAVFTVLGVLPLVLLGQIGVIVGVGVVLDTLLVRSILVPALVELVGPRFWWPSRPDDARPVD